MIILYVVALGIVQGFTEFLPVSSSLHMKMAKNILDDFLGIDLYISKEIYQSIQLGSVLPVIFYFRQDVKDVLYGCIRREKRNISLFCKMIIAYLPIICIGIMMGNYIYIVRGYDIASMSMIAVGMIFILLYYFPKKVYKYDIYDIGYSDALLIGIFQSFAIIEGISRFGSTFICALLLGIDKKTSIKFSFLLSIPTTLCINLYDVLHDAHEFDTAECIGFITSLVVGFISIKYILDAIIKHDSSMFFLGLYRCIVGLLIIMILKIIYI